MENEDLARHLFNAHKQGLKNCWEWDDDGLEDQHRGTHASYRRHAKKLTRELTAAGFEIVRK